MQSESEIRITRNGDKVHLAPGKDIIAAGVMEIRGVLKTMLDEGVRHLVIDLEGVRVIDSSGIGMLVAAYNSLSRLGGELAVVNASNDLLDLLKAFRLDRHFSISGTQK